MIPRLIFIINSSGVAICIWFGVWTKSVVSTKMEDDLKCSLCDSLAQKAVVTPCCNQLSCRKCSKRRLKAEGGRCWVSNCRRQLLFMAMVPERSIRKRVKRLALEETGNPSEDISRHLSRIDKVMEDVKRVLDYAYKTKDEGSSTSENRSLANDVEQENGPKPALSNSIEKMASESRSASVGSMPSTSVMQSSNVESLDKILSKTTSSSTTTAAAASVASSGVKVSQPTSCLMKVESPIQTTTTSKHPPRNLGTKDIVVIDLTEDDSTLPSTGIRNEVVVETFGDKEQKVPQKVNEEEFTFSFSDPIPIESLRKGANQQELQRDKTSLELEQSQHNQPQQQPEERPRMWYQQPLPWPQQQRRSSHCHSQLHQYQCFQQQQIQHQHQQQQQYMRQQFNWENVHVQQLRVEKKGRYRRRRIFQRQRRRLNYQEVRYSSGWKEHRGELLRPSKLLTFKFRNPAELPISSHRLAKIRTWLSKGIFDEPHLFELSAPTAILRDCISNKKQQDVPNLSSPLKDYCGRTVAGELREYFRRKREELNIPPDLGSDVTPIHTSTMTKEVPTTATKLGQAEHNAGLPPSHIPPVANGSNHNQCGSYWCGGIPEAAGAMERPDDLGRLFLLRKCDRCPTLELKCENDIFINRHPLQNKQYELNLHVDGVAAGAFIKIWTVPPRVERVGDGGAVRMLAPGVGTCFIKSGTKLFDCQEVRNGGDDESVIVYGGTQFLLASGDTFSYTFELSGDERNDWHRELVYLVLDDHYSRLLVKEGAVGVTRKSQDCWTVTVTLANPANFNKESFFFPGGRIGVLKRIKPEPP